MFQSWCSLFQGGRRRWPGSRSRTRSRRGWTDLENGSLVVSAAFCRHAIEPSVNEDHVVDRFSAIAIICFPANAVKALVIITTGIHHEDSAPDHFLSCCMLSIRCVRTQ